MDFAGHEREASLIVSLFLGHQFDSENLQDFLPNDNHKNVLNGFDWEGNEYAYDHTSAVLHIIRIFASFTK